MIDEVNEEKTPLVSIVITSYNRAAFICDAIESALSQDYANLEIIVTDNNSSDNTSELIKKYLPDTRFHFYENDTNIGMIPNFKLGTDRAKGQYITYVSSDDYLINNSFISEAINLIKTYKTIALVFSRNKTFIEKTQTLIEYKTHHLYSDEFVQGKKAFLNFANTKALGWGGTLMHRETLKKLNIFTSKATSLDYEANLLFMLHGDVGFIKKPTYVVRIHDNQASQQTKASQVIQNLSFIFTPYQFALSNNIFSKEVMNQWKSDLLFIELKSSTLQLLPLDRNEYDKLMDYVKSNYYIVYKRLKKDIKWNIFYFLYSRPKLSLKFMKFFSKGHYRNLKALVAKKY